MNALQDDAPARAQKQYGVDKGLREIQTFERVEWNRATRDELEESRDLWRSWAIAAGSCILILIVTILLLLAIIDAA